MELQEAVSLIKTDKLIQATQATWADLGCGSGLFTRALATILKPGSRIFAVDKNISSFKTGPSPILVTIDTLESDFVKEDLKLKNLDGILMANSIHFVKDKKSFLTKLFPYFHDVQLFLIVEYDTDL